MSGDINGNTMIENKVKNDRLEAALSYAEQGWPVLPVFEIGADGSCACPARDKCEHPGKHPRAARGVHSATTKPDQLILWWGMWPNANIGIATGLRSGMFVVDIDGPKGENFLNEKSAEHGGLPETIESQTGRGRQLFFLYPDRGTIRSGNGIATEIDIKSTGGYVIGAPSDHHTGRKYRWIRPPGSVPIAIPPPWLLDVIRARGNGKPNGNGMKPDTPARDGDRIPVNQRNTTLASLAGSMRRRGMTENEIAAALMVVNTERCEPELTEAEVTGIAASIAKYPPASCDGGHAPDDTRAPWPTRPEGALVGLAGEFVSIIEPHTEADPVALLVQFLTMFGNRIGRNAHMTVEGTKHYMNLFSVLVGSSSKGRKGTSWGRVLQVFGAKDNDNFIARRIVSGLSSGEGLIWHVRDAEDDAENDGKGVDDKRLMVVQSEFASVLKVMRREGNTLSTTLRDAWDTGNLRTMTKNSPAVATGAHISIIGHVTELDLRRYLGETEQGNGFGNRFLWVCARRTKKLPFGGNLPPSALLELQQRLTDTIAYAVARGEMKWTDAARQLWAEIYDDLWEERPGLFGSIVARAEAQTLRLAAIYALLDKKSAIEPAHLKAAKHLWDYCEGSAKYVFGSGTGNSVADTILSRIKAKPEGLTRTEISAVFNRHGNQQEIDNALNLLVQKGLIKVQTITTGGRSATRYLATGDSAKDAKEAK